MFNDTSKYLQKKRRVSSRDRQTDTFITNQRRDPSYQSTILSSPHSLISLQTHTTLHHLHTLPIPIVLLLALIWRLARLAAGIRRSAAPAPPGNGLVGGLRQDLGRGMLSGNDDVGCRVGGRDTGENRGVHDVQVVGAIDARVGVDDCGAAAR